LADLPDSPWLLDLDRVEVRRGAFRLVLSELSLQVARGELVFISGPSGSGKSTLLRLMAGIEQPTSGRVTIAGQDVARLGARARAPEAPDRHRAPGNRAVRRLQRDRQRLCAGADRR
jgi:ABC-type bacteriocin/lantibiotic exporter with double-glycine peptidase domain